MIELQKVLDNIYEWATSNNMNWDDHKFQQIRLRKNHNLKEDTLYSLPEMTYVIEVKEYVKDLGILVDDKVKYNHQLQKAITKTRQKIGWIT